MCLVVVALNDHPDYSLIVVANRDESYNRATLPADYWKDHPGVLGGRDLQAGGTWLAINANGRISMITNYRNPARMNPVAPSRGELVTGFVLSEERPLKYLEQVASVGDSYNGFNLLVGNPKELYYYSNYGNGIAPVSPGVHGLSNHLLDTPWPKVKNAVQKVRSILKRRSVNPENLLDVLYDDTVAPDNELPDTGVGLELERQLSSMFIKSQGYGSRSTTAILVDRASHVQFVERVYNTSDFSYSTQSYDFQIR